MNLMPDRLLFIVPPPFDDSRLTYGAAETKVVSTNRAYPLAVEAWLAIFDGCGEFPYAHIDWEDACVLAFESGFLLDGDVHVPVLAVSDQFAFAQVVD
jgi:hypothetical protein